MENIIKKAIAGGWEFKNKHLEEESGVVVHNNFSIVCDPLFWQALFKNPPVAKMPDNGNLVDFWFYQAKKFHHINLLDGWDVAVETLKKQVEAS